jgi:hypothetical protein
MAKLLSQAYPFVRRTKSIKNSSQPPETGHGRSGAYYVTALRSIALPRGRGEGFAVSGFGNKGEGKGKVVSG